jgi:putative methionine-R-sulfoxide reductase with GAF domain
MSGDVIKDVREAARAADSIDEAAAELAELIRATSGRRWVGIYRVTQKEVLNLAWSGPAPPAHPVFAATQGLTGAAIRSRATVCSNDVRNDPRYLTNQTTTGSELIVPITLDHEVVGTLDLEEGHADAFSPEDIELFEQVACVLTPLYRIRS